MTAGPLHLDNTGVCPCVQVMALELTKQFTLVGTGSFANFFFFNRMGQVWQYTFSSQVLKIPF